MARLRALQNAVNVMAVKDGECDDDEDDGDDDPKANRKQM